MELIHFKVLLENKKRFPYLWHKNPLYTIQRRLTCPTRNYASNSNTNYIAVTFPYPLSKRKRSTDPTYV